MNKEFRQAIAVLNQTTEDFSKGHTSAVAHGHTRGAAICAAVTAMARSFGVTLEPIGCIDARGELSIFAAKAVADGKAGCGRFGGPFATFLNEANVRTGIRPPAHLESESGWCYLNHFEAEKMVLRYAKSHA
jgi:hypothetical protein